MDRFMLSAEYDGGRQGENTHCDGDELDNALLWFLGRLSSDAKVTITYIGEEFEEE